MLFFYKFYFEILGKLFLNMLQLNTKITDLDTYRLIRLRLPIVFRITPTFWCSKLLTMDISLFDRYET